MFSVQWYMDDERLIVCHAPVRERDTGFGKVPLAERDSFGAECDFVNKNTIGR